MPGAFVPSNCFISTRKKETLPIFVVFLADYKSWLKSTPDAIAQWLSKGTFHPKVGACCLLPSDKGPAGALVIVKEGASPWDFASLPQTLPALSFEVATELSAEIAQALCLGWALGSYRFERYKKKSSRQGSLVWPQAVDRKEVLALAEGICITRDLVNLPASDMGPEELAVAAKNISKLHGSKTHVILGDALLKKNYPMIHAVGRASSRAPRLIDFRWGREGAPAVTLVGKGVCFDTGGLDLKPPQYMKLMKKDMGGAALVLGLAHAIMSLKLPIQLRVLIPAVENSVSGNAMRPLDVLTSRKGISVEVGDTDAEGRLVLADALTEADSENPDLIIDAATLTGAARVALGVGMPAIFSRKTDTWVALEAASEATADSLWRLPLHQPYRSMLNSKVADISNISGDAYGGAITAALFLAEFVKKDRDWVHMDTMGYNLAPRPGRPTGGEALGLLALLAMLRQRYGKAAKKKTGDDLGTPEVAQAPSNVALREDVSEKHLVKKAPRKKGPASGPRKSLPHRKA